LELGGRNDPLPPIRKFKPPLLRTKQSSTGRGARAQDLLRLLKSLPNPSLSLKAIGRADVRRKTEGRVRLFEESGSGQEPGLKPAPRLIATFHGTFHPPQGRKEITFQILMAGLHQPHSGEVLGFDPECILGVDAFLLTFVNREFVIYFPFLLDNRRQNKFLEFCAIAEDGHGNELGRSSILNLPIRHPPTLVTTTSNWKYKGRAIGNIMLHHEDYIFDQKAIPVQSKQVPGQIFDAYKKGNLQIVLMDDLLSGLTPEKKDLEKLPQTLSPEDWRNSLQGKLKVSLREIFLDAGFDGMQVFLQNDTGATNLVTAFMQSRAGGRAKPFEAPFWAFYVTRDDSMKHAGESEIFECKKPIGSGKKKILKPITIKTKGLTSVKIRPKGKSRSRRTQDEALARENSWLPRPDEHFLYDNNSQKIVEIFAKRTGWLIAHEIGHSLGLMHEIRAVRGGPYSERKATELLTIMCSTTERQRFGVEAKFSNQAKTIWINAFQVAPRSFGEAYYRNKTWTDIELKTHDWTGSLENGSWIGTDGRWNRFWHKNYEVVRWTDPYRFGSSGKVPPFAKSPPAVQRGTYKKRD